MFEAAMMLISFGIFICLVTAFTILAMAYYFIIWIAKILFRKGDTNERQD
jgi:large-conductance mechanosensitive channel